MKIGVRAALAAAAVGAAAGPAAVAWPAFGAGVLAQAGLGRGGRKALVWVIPVVLFAGLLAVAEWLARGQVSLLPLRTLAVFLLSTAAFQGVSGVGWAFRHPPGSLRGRLVVFGLFVAHFACILEAEARRALLAHRLAAPRRRGPGWFGSLGRALAGVFLRSLTRAERFYAAQWLRGLGE